MENVIPKNSPEIRVSGGFGGMMMVKTGVFWRNWGAMVVLLRRGLFSQQQKPLEIWGPLLLCRQIYFG